MILMLDWIIIRIICCIIVVFLSIDVIYIYFFGVNQKRKKKIWVKFIVKSGICEKLYLHQVIWFDRKIWFFFFLVIMGLNLELGVDHWLHDQLCNRHSNITHSVARQVLVPSLLFFQGLNIGPMDALEWTRVRILTCPVITLSLSLDTSPYLLVILSRFDYAWLLGVQWMELYMDW